MALEELSNGFGRLLPYTVFQVDPSTGLPSSNVIEIRSVETLFANVTSTNPILPVTQWPDEAILPDSNEGNHFLYARFRQDIGVDSVLDPAAGALSNSSLRGTISVLAVDPISGTTTPIPGRAFIGGQTYGSPDPESPGELRFERWVRRDENGNPRAVDVDGAFPGFGFPGTEQGTAFSGAGLLVDPRTFVFIPDSDGDLTTYETFPTDVQVTMRISTDVLSSGGENLRDGALGSTTVGVDGINPEIAVSGSDQSPTIIPGNGDTEVDPETDVLIEFTEPVQPATVGPFDDGTLPTISAAIQLEFGPSTSTVTVPYTIRPVSPFDLSRYILNPSYGFPGAGEELSGDITCGEFSEVRVRIGLEQFSDLGGMMNQVAPQTSFQTGFGPGLVNAPIAPDVIYVGRAGSEPGISVIDLNGFGAGTGNPTYDPANPLLPGNSRYPLNPNVQLQGSIMCPPLAPGTCTFNGGSSGVFSLTRDSGLNDKLARSPIITSVVDMALGHALDSTFNAAAPNGCQAGGGNICANTGLKQAVLATGQQGQVQQAGNNLFPAKTIYGGENIISFAPHPNPPPLVFPPLCLSPLIGGQEPTSIVTITPIPQGGKGLPNLLIPGDPFGNPDTFPQIPPSGLLAAVQNGSFNGPSPPAQQISACFTYLERQQLGQFLYVCDRVAQEIVVLNSNRFTVIDRIQMADPTSFAFSPNLDFLAVSSEGSNSVTFIDTDPGSATFHQVIKTVPVGIDPVGIAWEPGGEQIFVCNRGDNTVSLISGFSFNVRKTLIAAMDQPFEVCVTPRQFGFGFNRGVHFAYILNGNGRVTVYESGPSGTNGWGFDDVIGSPPITFDNPRAMVVNQTDLRGGVWIAHENPIGPNNLPSGELGPTISNMVLFSGTNGQIPLNLGPFQAPGLRGLEWSVVTSIGPDRLSGLVTDIAFDNLLNTGAFDNLTNQFSPSGSVIVNGKAIVKQGPTPANNPFYLFAAVPNEGVIDVISLDTGNDRIDTNVFEPGIQSIPARDANVLMDYFEQ